MCLAQSARRFRFAISAIPVATAKIMLGKNPAQNINRERERETLYEQMQARTNSKRNVPF